MSKSSHGRTSDEHELLNLTQNQSFPHDRTRDTYSRALGVPWPARRLWVSDYLSALICLLCCAVGLATIFVVDVATRLGQVNQLIVVGVTLQLMALFTARHVRAWLLAVECLWAGSSLQNYESIINTSFTMPNATFFVRAIIVLHILTPVGLGVAYKRFTGDRALTQGWIETGSYGMMGPPGTVGVGSSGLALLVNATAIWWNDPTSYGAYGFNLNVESPNRTATLDGPTPEFIQSLRSGLSVDNYILVEATVNATVTDMVIDLTDPAQKPDLAYWYQNATAASVSPQQATNDLWLKSDAEDDLTNTVRPDSEAKTRFSVLNWPKNSSFILTSRYNATAGQDFGSAAQGFHTYRQRYRARWVVTPNLVSLDHASPIADTKLTDNATRTLVEDNYVNVGHNFVMMFSEFDWKNGYADFIQPDERTIPGLSIQQQYVKSDTTLISASVWAILALINGPSNPLYLKFQDANVLNPMNVGLRYEGQTFVEMSVPVLHRSWLLILILAVNPIILLTTLVMRLTVLRDAPISMNFGLISLLGGINPDSLPLVRGAAYSGQLRTPVSVAFSVSAEDKVHDVIDISGQARNDRGHITATLLNPRHRDHYPGSSRTPRVRYNTLYS